MDIKKGPQIIRIGTFVALMKEQKGGKFARRRGQDAVPLSPPGILPMIQKGKNNFLYV